MATARRNDPEGDAGAPPWFVATEPERPRLTHERIVEEAHALVHADGADALSIRALARALGVGPSQLHRRIERKEHLLVAVADLVLSEIRVPSSTADQTPGAWKERLRAFAHEIRRVLAAHPHVHPILDSHVLVTPAAVRAAEHAIAILRDAGFDGDGLVDAYNAWAGYVFGFTVVEMQPQHHRNEVVSLERWVRRFLAELDTERHPAVRASLPALENRAFGLRWQAGPLGRDGGSFAFGLDALIEGLPPPRPRSGSGRIGAG